MADLKTGAEAPDLPETLRLKIVYRPIDDLTPYKGNARTHSEKQIAQIAASIRKFGFTNPVLIDARGQIVAGHGRVTAARQLGRRDVPTIELGHLTEAERRAYVIADNRLAELAGWDREILAIELQALTELDLDFELEITGFETAELDLLLDGILIAGQRAGIHGVQVCLLFSQLAVQEPLPFGLFGLLAFAFVFRALPLDVLQSLALGFGPAPLQFDFFTAFFLSPFLHLLFLEPRDSLALLAGIFLAFLLFSLFSQLLRIVGFGLHYGLWRRHANLVFGDQRAFDRKRYARVHRA